MSMISYAEERQDKAKIKVIGVGGCGGNALKNLNRDIDGVEYIYVDTDPQKLALSTAHHKIHLAKAREGDKELTGAGSKPELGRQAAENYIDQIRDVCEGANMIFIMAGMGGGTGTGASPVVAKIVKELGILSVGVVTLPFDSYGLKVNEIAREGLEEVSKYVDSLLVINNEKVGVVLGDDAPMCDVWETADKILLNGVQGISDIILRPGEINTDFQDICTVFESGGRCIMATGVGSGDNAAQDAIDEALASPYIEGEELRGATGILCNIVSSRTIRRGDFVKISKGIEAISSSYATIIKGHVYDDDMGDTIQVTVIATGFSDDTKEDAPPESTSPEFLFSPSRVSERSTPFGRYSNDSGTETTGLSNNRRFDLDGSAVRKPMTSSQPQRSLYPQDENELVDIHDITAWGRNKNVN